MQVIDVENQRLSIADAAQQFPQCCKGFPPQAERIWNFLFTLRLIPAVPFFVINAVMGLTPIRTTTFWWVSQLGMLPGTVLYIYAGSRVPGLKTLADRGIGAVFTPGQITQLLIAFALLGVFPLVARWLLRRFGPRVEQ